MSRPAEMLKEFHDKYGCSLNPYIIETRRKLLKEEAREYQEAEDQNDLVAIADALGDIVYVVFGTALLYGLDLDQILEEMHRSNMTKTKPEIYGGKVFKGPDYSPPDIRKIVWGTKK